MDFLIAQTNGVDVALGALAVIGIVVGIVAAHKVGNKLADDVLDSPADHGASNFDRLAQELHGDPDPWGTWPEFKQRPYDRCWPGEMRERKSRAI